MKLEMLDFDLEQWVRNIDDLIGPQAAQKGIFYTTKTHLIQKWVMGDAMHLKQVLINLLGNALKFTGKDGHILFAVSQRRTAPDRTEISFSVEDTGIGIEAEDQKRIFHSFEQAGESTARKFGGTGLGLAISSQLVQMMDGEISLESEPDKGSRFSFAIVLKDGDLVYDGTPTELFGGAYAVEEWGLRRPTAAALAGSLGFTAATPEEFCRLLVRKGAED